MTTITLHGVVGWDIDAEEFASILDNTTGDIEFELNSGGGYVTDGVSILNKIRAYDKGKTVAKISYAASMMTQIALACDEVQAYDNAIFMIHNVQGITIGDHNDMREQADLQERMSAMLAKLYVKKTGKTEDEIKQMMDADTYLFGDEIVANGFADSIIDTDKEKNQVVAMQNADALNDKAKKAMKEEKLSVTQLKEQFTQCMGECSMVADAAVPTVQANDKPALQIQGENMTNEEIMASEPYMNLVASHEEQVNSLRAEMVAQEEKTNAWKAQLPEVCKMAVARNVSQDTLITMVTSESMEKAKVAIVDGMGSKGAFGASETSEEADKANNAKAFEDKAKAMGVTFIEGVK